MSRPAGHELVTSPSGSTLRLARSVLLVLLGVLLACWAPQARAGVIVSLGDSYSSGEGSAPYDRDTDVKGSKHKCHRSDLGWPRLIGVTADHHLACSGAVVANIPETGDRGPAQNDASPDDVTQVTRLKQIAGTTAISRVVMTIGGNDAPVSFAKHLRNCRLLGAHECLRDVDKVIGELPSLRTRLANTYRNVQAAASGAPVLVVGYPDLFPAPSAKRVKLHCGWLDRPTLQRLEKLEAALDSTIAGAASDANVDYVTMRDALKGHELCTGWSWIRALGGKPGDITGDQQQGHPLKEGQTAMAIKVLHWLNQHRGQCQAASRVATILDNSGSMDSNDPENIRAQAMQLLLTKPDNQSRVFGAIKFGDDAEALFAPGPVGPNQAMMLGTLAGLDNASGGTDYNAAFSESAAEQPDADARIFLTDGGHNAGTYANGHQGGPPTYVIGLNIGPAGSDEDANRLQQIAADTGGKYFPLKLADGDTPAVQVGRLQSTINDIDSRITCDQVQAESAVTVTAPGTRTGTARTLFAGSPGMEVVLSWANPDAEFGLGSLTVRDRAGRVVGDLLGTKRIGHSRKKRTKIALGQVDGQTFSTVTFKRPKNGSGLTLTVTATALPAPTAVTIQIRPIDHPPTAPSTTTVPVAGSQPGGGSQGGDQQGQAPKPKGRITATVSGSGTIASNPAGIACPTTCTATFDSGATVTLTPTPAAGWSFAGWTGDCSGVGACTITADAAAAKTVKATFSPPPPHRVDAYSNYGPATAGRAMCRGNPGTPSSMPGGTATQTFTVPAGVASLDHATIQIDPDSRVNAHLTVFVNGAARASADAAAAGDTQFSFSSVGVTPGDTVTFSISFSASFGKIITVYSAAAVGGTLTIGNSCPDGAPSLTSANGLRAVVSGWST
ncbi:MAG TPA: GDSL-type esterase/lipase family protein [Baekduia sp.]|uniref:GDSL-type esterase/lipase family protein n=1 Tax=Baekduia sp. TaxID=2600305 RepID=UPI002D774A99|nr:GDSL-type esterase/lipase family protein [Baekduia sp.]HET6505856.1 GDSL-type esterase/lipase family protein [Baekduia sp.]